MKGFHAKKLKGKRNFNVKPMHDDKMKHHGKYDSKKNMNMVKYFNYQKLGYFVKDCSQSKRVREMEKVCTFPRLNYYSFISSFVPTIDTFPS